jgi:hypothetical protein
MIPESVKKDFKRPRRLAMRSPQLLQGNIRQGINVTIRKDFKMP